MFTICALKSLSAHFNLSIISGLVQIDCFSLPSELHFLGLIAFFYDFLFDGRHSDLTKLGANYFYTPYCSAFIPGAN